MRRPHLGPLQQSLACKPSFGNTDPKRCKALLLDLAMHLADATTWRTASATDNGGKFASTSARRTSINVYKPANPPPLDLDPQLILPHQTSYLERGANAKILVLLSTRPVGSTMHSAHLNRPVTMYDLQLDRPRHLDSSVGHAEPCRIAFPCSSAFASSQHAGGRVACVRDSQAPTSGKANRALHRVALRTRLSPPSFYPPKRCASIGCAVEVTHRASWVPRSVIPPYC
ncbi:hypothetical protein C8Q73DRAFT_363760 [Cubamyces lactineus]|nr:hypothetical protein C8Q73DRAFT_363760 [Cubamyces lactineus]